MLKEKLQEDLKNAMRGREEARLRAIRALRAALMEREIQMRTGGEAELTEDQEMSVVQKQAKQRRDSIAQFRDAGRDDLVRKEEEELAFIEEYLPRQLSDEELLDIVGDVVEQAGATSMADMGKVMGAAMGRVQGRADGKRVQAAVRSLLGG